MESKSALLDLSAEDRALLAMILLHIEKAACDLNSIIQEFEAQHIDNLYDLLFAWIGAQRLGKDALEKGFELQWFQVEENLISLTAAGHSGAHYFDHLR